MAHRIRNFLATFLAVLLARLAEPLWTRNVENVIDKRGWDQALDAVIAAMPDWLGGLLDATEWIRPQGFWGGAFTVLAVWGLFEAGYAVQRRRKGVQGSSVLDRAIYIGRIHIDANRLLSDYLLEFAVVAYNATGTTLRVSGVRGTISYGPSTTTPDSDFNRLPAPALREDGPPEIAPGAEFMVIVIQHVPGALAAEMDKDLAAGKRVMFVLEELEVSLESHADTQPVRMPIWKRVSCDRAGKLTVTFQIITGEAHIVV